MIQQDDLSGMFEAAGLKGDDLLSGGESERFRQIRDEIRSGVRPRNDRMRRIVSVFRPPLPRHFD